MYHIAQLNIALMCAPLDSPIMADFVAWLEPVNAIADSAPGFIWRLQSESGDATSIRAFDEDYMLVNMSVWKSVDDLYQYVYKSDHAQVFRRRKEWFELMEQSATVMWWIPAGHIPTVDEAKIKLELLRKNGPTPQAFTFKQQFSVEDMLKTS
jgi:Domain of unknown function (DUF3291)